MSTWESFTQSARRSVALAQEEAEGLGSSHIATEHILLGILREGESTAAKALETSGVNLPKVRAQVETIVGRSENPRELEMAFTPGAKMVIMMAFEEARHLRQTHISTEHLLLGLIRDGGGVAARVFTNLGVEPEKIAQQVRENLSAG